jgi:DNA-binding NarL/FixJ family response regulator
MSGELPYLLSYARPQHLDECHRTIGVFSSVRGLQQAALNREAAGAEPKLASPYHNSTHGASGGAGQPDALRDQLTQREIEVLKLMAEGLTTNRIARSLGIAFKTAACHRYRILDKLGVKTTVQALRWAIRNGWVEP